MNSHYLHLHRLPTLSASLQNHKTFSTHQRGGALDFPQKSNFTKRTEIVAVADELLLELRTQQVEALESLMMYFADHALFPHFRCVWDQLLNSSSFPSIPTLRRLFRSLAVSGHSDQIPILLAHLTSRCRSSSPRRLQDAFCAAVSSFADAGQIDLMEATLRTMASDGLTVSAAAANAYVRCYSVYGSLPEMEAAYGRLKRSRYCIDVEGIRAVALAYLRNNKLYRLGEFAREVGLGRTDVGNLLWNLLLLSYAASFKMKSLQREFLRMIDCGFSPDITTFNVRAIAFSRMSLLWDLHLSLQHMRLELVVPDVVTYGCIVDSYLERRLGRNLEFALNAMPGLDDSYPAVLTDPLVFEVLGKGDFHASFEAFLEFSAARKNWTYRKLIDVYKKKHYRRNQIFWNY